MICIYKSDLSFYCFSKCDASIIFILISTKCKSIINKCTYNTHFVYYLKID